MSLKEIQLVGFKSFADKTSVPLQEGVTCIVGPNGCGKSNVSDAVRWVLGEQSTKNMRTSSRSDVIFNGTDKRRSLSFCEVTLTFDNTDKLFDIDYGEVAMTRRLYRSGESEYLLNKENCRLKDIVALLHGVGLGKEGYSIIGQGKVQQIVNSKPEERRVIFEEATGIMIQKQRKQEIERRLAESEDCLTVYKQRMAEAERQIGPLSRQAETAQKYNEYAGELKYHEVNAYIYRCENAETTKKKYAGESERLNAEIGQYSQEIADVLAEKERLRDAVAEADTRLAGLNASLLSYTVGNTEKNANARLYKERADAFREKLRAAQEDISACEERADQIGEEIGSCDKTVAEKKRLLASLKNESGQWSEKIGKLNAEIAEYEREAMQDRIKELSSIENLTQLKENKGSLSARKVALEERIEEVKAGIAAQDARREALKKEIALAADEIGKLEKFVTSFDGVKSAQNDVIRGAREKQESINADIYSCEAAIQSAEKNLDVYIGLKNRFEGYKDSVRRLLYAAKSNGDVRQRIRGVIADIVSCEEKYELAIETLFGGAMQNIVTATREDARDLIAFLKRNNMGVVTFLPVDSMRIKYNGREIERALSDAGALGLADEIVRYDPYFAPVIRNLLGNTLVCDNMDNAVRIAKKYANAFRIVTLDGDVIATGGSMTGGSRKKDAGNLLQNERLIKSCEEEIEKKKKERAALRVSLAQTQEERVQAEKKLEELNEQFRERSNALATCRQREASLQQLLGEVEETVTSYHEALRSLQEKRDHVEDETFVFEESEKALAKIRSEADEERERRNRENEEKKREREGVNERYTALQLKIVEVGGEISNAQGEKARLIQERADLEQNARAQQGNCLHYEQEIDRWEREAEKQALTKEEQETVAVLRAEIEKASGEKQQINVRQGELEARQSAVQEKITQASERRGKYEQEIVRIDTGLENFRQRIAEVYDLTYDECLPMRDENYDVASSANEIASLKRRITALGPVNENALEDYEELKKRYDEMVVQRDDVEKGIADSTEMLEEIKKDMQTRFDEGFRTINENFKQVFKELFGGGRAELLLDYENCEDPLDAGVVIDANPPGKKVGLMQLSGGEQSLTAIAILFAILKTNPMPFCILDEIEAALDDANVDRFAKYLKKFSRETQFIVITHRKPTMAQADSLFGVTMEEKGVSKIVSVKLSDVESRLGGDTVQ